MPGRTAPLANGVLILKLALPIPAAVENPPHFHDVAYDNVEDHKIAHLNPLIRMLALFDRMIRLKRFWTGQPLLNSGFDIGNKAFRGVGILQMNGDIVNDFVEVVFKKRQKAEFIRLLVHGYVS